MSDTCEHVWCIVQSAESKYYWPIAYVVVCSKCLLVGQVIVQKSA